MVTHAVTTGLIICIAIVGMFAPVEIGTYRDAMYVQFEGVSWGAFQLNGVLFGGPSAHEYGHAVQQRERGDLEFYTCVAIPSVLAYGSVLLGVKVFEKDYAWVERVYYRLPFEREADLLGGVVR